MLRTFVQWQTGLTNRFSDIPGETCDDWRNPKNSQLKNFGRTPCHHVIGEALSSTASHSAPLDPVTGSRGHVCSRDQPSPFSHHIPGAPAGPHSASSLTVYEQAAPLLLKNTVNTVQSRHLPVTPNLNHRGNQRALFRLWCNLRKHKRMKTHYSSFYFFTNACVKQLVV